MSDLRALGVHTYFGGFEVGVRRTKGIKSLGSMESWKPAVAWAPKLGVRVRDNWMVPKADYVFSNPPCARFSSLSFSKFQDNMREDLNTFPDMIETLEVAKTADAKLLHVESGPLMFTRGAKLISQFNDILQWPEIYTLVLKICCTYAGLPQRRPRTHVFVGRVPFPELTLTPAPLPVNLGEFFKGWNSEYNYEAVPSQSIPNPIAYSGIASNTATFLSTRPKILSTYDQRAHSVVSSRHFAWLEEERWFSVDEYAGVQGYEATDFDYSEPGIPLAMALISKSVSPYIAEYLAKNVVLPYFDSGDREKHGKIMANLT